MPVQTEHRFKVKDYYRMAETGVLSPYARVELLDGRIRETILRSGDQAKLLAFPDVAVDVADLLKR